MVSIGNQIRKAREQRNLTQKELGVKIGISASYISHIESGKRSPDAELVRQIAGVLNVPVARFFEDLPLGKSRLPHTLPQGLKIALIPYLGRVNFIQNNIVLEKNFNESASIPYLQRDDEDSFCLEILFDGFTDLKPIGLNPGDIAFFTKTQNPAVGSLIAFVSESEEGEIVLKTVGVLQSESAGVFTLEFANAAKNYPSQSIQKDESIFVYVFSGKLVITELQKRRFGLS